MYQLLLDSLACEKWSLGPAKNLGRHGSPHPPFTNVTAFILLMHPDARVRSLLETQDAISI